MLGMGVESVLAAETHFGVGQSEWIIDVRMRRVFPLQENVRSALNHDGLTSKHLKDSEKLTRRLKFPFAWDQRLMQVNCRHCTFSRGNHRQL